MRDHHYDSLQEHCFAVVQHSQRSSYHRYGMGNFTNEITDDHRAQGPYWGDLKVSSNSYTPSVDGDLVVTKHDEGLIADFPAEPSSRTATRLP